MCGITGFASTKEYISPNRLLLMNKVINNQVIIPNYLVFDISRLICPSDFFPLSSFDNCLSPVGPFPIILFSTDFVQVLN